MKMKKTKISVIAIGFALVILTASVMSVVAVPMPIPVKGVVQWADGTMVPDGWTVSLENLNETYPDEPWTTTTNSSLAPLNYFFTGTAENTSTFVITASDPTGTFTGSETFTADPLETKIVNITVRTLTTITVSPSTATLYVGGTQQFTATAKDQYGNVLPNIIFTWTSSNTTVGTIDANGLFTAKAVGTTTVNATNGSVSGTASVTVLEAPALTTITVSPSTATLYVGGTQQFTATAKDQYGNVLPNIIFTWTSSNTTVGTIDANGLFTAKAVGTTTVKAENVTTGVNGTAQVTVQELVLTSITVSPSTATLYVGGTKQFTAIAKDQSGKPMAGITIVWTSSDTTVGTVSPASATTDSNGKATTTFTAKSAGSTTIKAENLTTGVNGTATVTVLIVSGGGGARVPSVPPGTSEVRTTAEGKVESTVTAASADAKAAATITAGTIAKDAAGKPLAKVTITPPSVLPAAPPATVSYVGYAYNFGPAGATFNPAIEISIEFDPAKFEGKTPVIYTYEDEAGKWVRLDTRIEDNKAIAKVDHFSTFVLFGEEKVTPPTTTPTATPTVTIPPTATPTPTPTPTATPTATPKPPGFEAVFAIAGLLAIAYLVLRQKKK